MLFECHSGILIFRPLLESLAPLFHCQSSPNYNSSVQYPDTFFLGKYYLDHRSPPFYCYSIAFPVSGKVLFWHKPNQTTCGRPSGPCLSNRPSVDNSWPLHPASPWKHCRTCNLNRQSDPHSNTAHCSSSLPTRSVNHRHKRKPYRGVARTNNSPRLVPDHDIDSPGTLHRPPSPV